MNKFLILNLVLLSALISGCAVGPDFERPKADLPESFSQTENGMSEESLSEWWKIFGDAKLVSLMDRALEGNLDLQAAKARVGQARSTLGISQSGLFPMFDASASMTEKSRTGRPLDQAAPSYGIGASTAWEIDIFGGTRREIEAYAATYKSALAEKSAVRVMITAELAQAYFNYRALQQALIITKKNLETQKKTYGITKDRFEHGFVPKLDTIRSNAQVESTSSQIPSIEADMEKARYAIEYLLGLQTGALREELSDVADLPKIEKYIPKSVPANLVERRPDIIVAEHKVHSATAKIGSARAEYYPKFAITGRVSYEAPNVNNFFKDQYGSWSIGPSISWNLFQAGKTFYNVRLQESIAKEAEIGWKNAVLKALKEVEDSMISASKEKEKISNLNTLVSLNEEAVNLSNKLYSGGEIEFNDLLDAQRSLLFSEQNLISSRQQFISNLISLYKSLGGGWVKEDIEEKADLMFDFGLLSD